MSFRAKRYFILVFFLFFVSGCGSNQEAAVNEKVELSPQDLYKNNCSGCHGSSLEGAIGPALNKIGSTLTEDKIATVIEKGTDKMPPQTLLTEEERTKLAKWLAEKQ